VRRGIAASLVALLLALSACSPSPTPTPAAPTSTPAESTSTIESPASPPPAPGSEIFGFIPYWEMNADIVEHVGQTPLTTLVLFSVTNTTKGAIKTNAKGYQQITGAVGDSLIRVGHDHGMDVQLSFSSFGAARNRRLFGRPDLHDRVITELVRLTDQLGVDGVNVDVETLDPALVPAYGSFVGDLRVALRAGGAEREVSVATTANLLGATMARAAVEAGADRVFMMAYDYRTGASEPGATTPLARRDGGSHDVPRSMDLYATLGVPAQQTILGLPLYGYAWPVPPPTAGIPLLDLPAAGRGAAWIPRRHLDVLSDPTIEPVRDDLEGAQVYLLGPGGSTSPPPSAEPGEPWQVVYVDSPVTLAPKVELARLHGFAGIGFWAIGYERGLPGYTDLMRRFAAGEPLTQSSP
jgi:Glycosyl hydrolases family 18